VAGRERLAGGKPSPKDRFAPVRHSHRLLQRGEEGAAVKILRFIHLTFAQAYYSRALKEINPLHPDVPSIVLRRRQLAEEARRLFA
jgi:hypothetical protein